MRSYKLLIFLVIFVLAGSLLYALQVKIKNKQYKRTHQNALSLITGKKAAEAASTGRQRPPEAAKMAARSPPRPPEPSAPPTTTRVAASRLLPSSHPP